MGYKIDYNKCSHLKSGDPLPPYNAKLRLYNMRLCPFAQRTVLALNAKQLDYEVINIDLITKPDWLVKKNPHGKVPILEVANDVTVYESLLTVEYIDETYPQRPLLPKDSLRRVQEKMFVKSAEPIEILYFKLVKSPAEVTEAAISAYHDALSFIQGQLQARGSTFLSGIEPGYADYMIWPWLERFITFEDDRVRIGKERYGLLLEYINRMFEDAVVKSYLTPVKAMIKLHKEFAMGTFITQCLDDVKYQV